MAERNSEENNVAVESLAFMRVSQLAKK